MPDNVVAWGSMCPGPPPHMGETVDVVYARWSQQVVTPDGGRWDVKGGQHWPADDPVVNANPALFSSDPRFGVSYSSAPAELSEPPVEQATAGPGEKRNVRRS